MLFLTDGALKTTETHLQAGDSVIWDIDGGTIAFHRGHGSNSNLRSGTWGDKHLVRLQGEAEFLTWCSIIAAVVPGNLRPNNMRKLHWNGWQCDFVDIPRTV